MASPPSLASQILVDRLNAHRHGSRAARRQSDFGPLPSHPIPDDLFIAEAQESTLRESTPRRTAAAVTPKPMGTKETEEKIQRLEKTTFDLQLEVHERRKRERALQLQLQDMTVQVRRAEKLLEEHAELLRLKEALAADLEKANGALDQAVGMICELEIKNKELLASSRSVHSDSGYGGSALVPVRAVAPQSPNDMATAPRYPLDMRSSVKQPVVNNNRIPSFMSDTDERTLALRQAYTGSGKTLKQAQSFVSILSQNTLQDRDHQLDLPSPKLSMLSETSLLSERERLDEGLAQPVDHFAAQVNVDYRQQVDYHSPWHEDSIKKVNKWIDLDHVDPTINSKRSSLRDSALFSGRLALGTVEQPKAHDEYPENDYPDGDSITTGTPSRFRAPSSVFQEARSEEPQSTVAKHETSQHRRKSSAEMHTRQAERPAYLRAATTPQGTQSPSATNAQSMLSPTRPQFPDPRPASSSHAVTPSHPRPTHTRHQSAAPLITKQGTRASLAAKTHRFLDRLTSGAHHPPPPRPDMEHARPAGMVKSATLADMRHPLPSAGNMPLDPASFDDADERDGCDWNTTTAVAAQRPRTTTAKTGRRRSVGPATTPARHDAAPRVAELSRTGAKAAWSSAGAGGTRSLSVRDGGRGWRG